MVERPLGVDQLVPVEVAADVVALLSFAAGGVLEAGGSLSFAGAFTMTVRVVVLVRPELSDTT
jgi:hypothetical protein